MVSSNNEFELKASIALNNMAVIMTDQGNFNESFETSKAAVTTLQIATDAPNQETGRALIRGCLAQAFQYASSSLDKQQHSPSSSQAAAAEFLHIVWHDCPTVSIDRSPLLTAIRIREDDISLLEESSLNVLTAMVLHNFAITSIVSNFVVVSTPLSANILRVQPGSSLQDAIVVLHLSRQMLEDAATRHDFSSAFSNENDEDPSCGGAGASKFVTSQQQQQQQQRQSSSKNNRQTTNFFSKVIGITTVVLTTLKRMLQINGNSDEAFACVARLVQVRDLSSVLNDQRVCCHNYLQELPASAA